MLNRCDFIGNLGRDPEVRYTQGGEPVCSFSIGCTEKWEDKSGQPQEKTEWINITAWGKLAEICGEYLHKGDRCYISGKMTTTKYQDKESGKDRWKTEITAKEMKMLSPPKGQQSGQSEDRYERQQESGEDGVPF